MKKLFKLILLPAILLLAVANFSNAAFPLEKQGTQTVAVSAVPAANQKVENRATKAELKKELKKFKNEHWYSGGKNKIVAALLCFFLGTLGIHSFYMGQSAKGFMQLGGTVAGYVLLIAGEADYISGTGESFPTLALIGLIVIFAVGVWALIDFVRILTGSLEPEEGFEG